MRALLVVMLATAPAVADPAPMAPATDDKAPPIAPPAPQAANAPAGPMEHVGQFGLSLRLALGVRAIAPYTDGVYCGKTDASTSSGNAPVCVGRAPFSLDLEASYGIRARLDAFLEIKLGIESDFGSTPQATDGPHLVHVSPGVRVFFSEAKRSKLFSTGQLVLDFSSYKEPGGLTRGVDFGVRNLNGIWFELDRSYALYLYAGETLTFVRWLAFELEGGFGFEARY